MGRSAKVRKEAGTVGSTDCRNRYSILAGGLSRGSSSTRPTTGDHIMNEVTTKKKCNPKCSGSERRDASTSEGQCDTATNTLKAISATIGRVKKRAALSTAGGETSALRSQRGVPISNSGGAIRENTMCWTMWTENR